jgi:hypothetical protein
VLVGVVSVLWGVISDVGDTDEKELAELEVKGHQEYRTPALERARS